MKLESWIEDELVKMPFVQWDRYVTGEWAEGTEYLSVYGWIDRDDDYKDFVEVIFWENKHRYFTTSSEEYTEDIFEVLFDESLDEHNDCKRVEDVTEIENVVML